MQFDKLHLNPARNPAVLATATWDPDRAWQIIAAQEQAYWQALQQAGSWAGPHVSSANLTLHSAARVDWRGSKFGLATLEDGQQLLLELGSGQGLAVLGQPIGQLSFGPGDNDTMFAYPTDLTAIAGYVDSIHPAKGPQAMRAEPRLGIGSRMTVASWPGIFRAMAGAGFSANAIQNSVREANLLEDLLAGRPAELNYGPNLGTFASGHAGSSFEGLWLYGVLAALKSEGHFRYGADADHMQVKRGAGKLERAKRVLESVRHYTFYTMDVSDVLDYGALSASPAAAAAYLAEKIAETNDRREVVAYHQQPYRLTGQTLQLNETAIGCFVGKYWDALHAMQELTDHVASLKNGRPFDLEFAVDEAPSGVQACDSITSAEELLFIIRECRRRDLPITHVAPNFGIEKEMDYRCCDGLTGLEQRVRFQTEMAQEAGLMLDFHSGDDLSAQTRRVIGRATQGYNHFKISPSLQLLFAETLADVHPEIFRLWWDDTLEFARREAAKGSPLATQGLHLFETGGDRQIHAGHMVFRHYCFASVGRRDEEGQYLFREKLYDLSPEFNREYGDRLERFLSEIAADLFPQGAASRT